MAMEGMDLTETQVQELEAFQNQSSEEQENEIQKILSKYKERESESA